VTNKELLELITNGLPSELEAYAAEHIADEVIKRKLTGYKTNWHSTAEYRGAVVYIHRHIVRKILARGVD
jgi:hypothetical protein